jgi:hypothetical protein
MVPPAERSSANETPHASTTVLITIRAFAIFFHLNLLQEIEELINFGFTEIFDDTGTFPTGEWLEIFCREMIDRGYNDYVSLGCNMRFGALRPEDIKLMAKAGFRMILWGFESANQTTLDKLNIIKTTGIKHLKHCISITHLNRPAYSANAAVAAKSKLPKHIAIIMDGNGRWAKKKLLNRISGHARGVDAVREVVTACRELGIKVLTLYALSTENLRRPKDEVTALMGLLKEYLLKEREEMEKKKKWRAGLGIGVLLGLFGAEDTSPSPQDVARMEEELDKIEEGGLTWVTAVRDFYDPFRRTFRPPWPR